MIPFTPFTGLVFLSVLATLVHGGIGHFHLHSGSSRSSWRLPLAHVDHHHPREGPWSSSSWIKRRRNRQRSHVPIASEWMPSVRGGSDFNGFGRSNTRESSTQTEDKVQFQVKTEAGFKDLDKKLDVTMEGRTTVAQLKAFIEERMLGKPPALLQRLFHGGVKLKDEQTIGEIFQDSSLPLPIILDMPPPIEQLDYEALIQLRVRYNALDHKQLQFYAANAVGLKYAIQALEEHLMKRPSSSEADDEDEDTDDEEDDGEGEDQRTRAMKDEIAALKDFLKKQEHELPPPPTIAPEQGMVKGMIRELGIPGLEEFVKAFALQLNLDWSRTSRYALGALIFGCFGAQGMWRNVLLAMVPGVFLLQLRPFRYGAKVAWELMAISPLVGGFSSALLSAPQQVLLTFDEKSYLEKLYGEEDVPPMIGPPIEGELAEEEGEEGNDDDEMEEEETSMTTQAGDREEEDAGEEEWEEGGDDDEGDDDEEGDEEEETEGDEEEEEEDEEDAEEEDEGEGEEEIDDDGDDEEEEEED